jgi:hypothetical protein
MNALPNEFDLAEATMLSPDTGTAGEPDPALVTEQWEAVHEAAAAVGVLAQLGRETISPEVADLPQRAARKGGWHYAMAARGIDDIAAFMQPGLRALLALTAKGQDTTAAALTLWREFHAARCAIGELVETA